MSDYDRRTAADPFAAMAQQAKEAHSQFVDAVRRLQVARNYLLMVEREADKHLPETYSPGKRLSPKNPNDWLNALGAEAARIARYIDQDYLGPMEGFGEQISNLEHSIAFRAKKGT